MKKKYKPLQLVEAIREALNVANLSAPVGGHFGRKLKADGVYYTVTLCGSMGRLKAQSKKDKTFKLQAVGKQFGLELMKFNVLTRGNFAGLYQVFKIEYRFNCSLPF